MDAWFPLFLLPKSTIFIVISESKWPFFTGLTVRHSFTKYFCFLP